MNQNLKTQNTLIKERKQIEQGISEEVRTQIQTFLKRNPNYVFNRLGKTAKLFDYESEKVFLINLKNELGITWSQLYSLIDLIKYNLI